MQDFKIHFKNGKKELKFEVSGFEGKEELQFLQNIVGMFNINMRNMVDKFEPDELLKSMGDDDKQLEQLQAGYNALVNDDGLHHPTSEYEQTPHNSVSINKQSGLMEEAFKKAQLKKRDDIPQVALETTSTENISLRYQAYYVCPKCQNRGKRRVPKETTFIYCHDCNERMVLRDAHDNGFPHTDSFGNYFIAGNFVKVSSNP